MEYFITFEVSHSIPTLGRFECWFITKVFPWEYVNRGQYNLEELMFFDGINLHFCDIWFNFPKVMCCVDSRAIMIFEFIMFFFPCTNASSWMIYLYILCLYSLSLSLSLQLVRVPNGDQVVMGSTNWGFTTKMNIIIYKILFSSIFHLGSKTFWNNLENSCII